MAHNCRSLIQYRQLGKDRGHIYNSSYFCEEEEEEEESCIQLSMDNKTQSSNKTPVKQGILSFFQNVSLKKKNQNNKENKESGKAIDCDSSILDGENSSTAEIVTPVKSSKTKKSAFDSSPSSPVTTKTDYNSHDSNDSIVIVDTFEEKGEENIEKNGEKVKGQKEDPKSEITVDHLREQVIIDIDNKDDESSNNNGSIKKSISSTQKIRNIENEGCNKSVVDEKTEEKLSKKELLKKERLLKKQQREEELKKEKELRKQKREEEMRKNRELKQQQREETRKKREEERLRIKKEKEAAKLEEKCKRDEEKLRKEEEKRQREEEKKLEEQNKERAQSRIGNFFRRVNDSSRQEAQKSDYQKYFLPFYSKDTVIMAQNFILSKSDLDKSKEKMDKFLSSSSSVSEEKDRDVDEWLKSKYEKRGFPIKYKAVNLLQQMTSKEKTDEELQVLLSLIPQKYIKFYENVRPPFIGTYSNDKILPINKPYSTEETGFNYDYDSDLEWVNEEAEDGGDGGDVDNLESGDDDDDEDEEEDGSEGEFDGFLDTEDLSNSNNSKKRFVGPLIPTVNLRSNFSQFEEDDKEYFNQLSAIPLMETMPFPIDPTAPLILSKKADENNNSMKRLSQEGDDITTHTNTHAMSISADSSGSTSTNHHPSSTNKKAKTLILDSKDLLKLFDEIHGSTFSLGTVTEIAQKGLPQYNKQTIKNTVKHYAIKSSGRGDTPRKWEIKDMQYWEQLKDNI